MDEETPLQKAREMKAETIGSQLVKKFGGDHRIGWSYILLSPLYLGE